MLDFGLALARFTASLIVSSGSTPESAIRPANIDKIAGVSEFITSRTPLSCCRVKIAVMLQTTPRLDNFFIKSTEL